MRNVHLYGHLAKKFGKVFRLDVNTPGEAIRLLSVNFPGFTVALREGSYQLIRGRRRGGMSLDLEQVEMRLGAADFHLVPVLAGSKNSGGVLKTVLGVALIGAAIFLSGGTLAAPLSGMGAGIGGLGGLTYGNIAAFGLITALTGVSQLISSPAKAETKSKKEDSFAFSGPVNVQEQGFPVPLIYGEVITGALPVSSGFDVFDIAVGA